MKEAAEAHLPEGEAEHFLEAAEEEEACRSLVLLW